MSITQKSLDSISVADLQDLIDSGARETDVLEFKGALPVSSIKGGPTEDRWIERGDRIGDYARDQLLAEIVAFANGQGGTLILGLHESKNEPRIAESLSPLPNCEGLAKRIMDAAEDVVEPRLTTLVAKAVAADTNGTGFVILRAAKSLFGPHRLTTTRDFYVRRGERASKMTAREIRDHSLNLANSGDRVRELFAARLADAGQRFDVLNSADEAQYAPLVIRVSAAPMSPQSIDRLTERPKLWWLGKSFTMKVDDTDYPCQYPAREFAYTPDLRLRTLMIDHSREEGGVNRLLTSDGLVEFTLIHPWRDLGDGKLKVSRFYFGWLYSLIVGAFGQVRHLQQSLAWDAIDFGMSVSIFAVNPCGVSWQDHWRHSGMVIKNELPLMLPLYEVTDATSVDDIIIAVTQDIFNACGQSIKMRSSVPSTALVSG